MPGCIVIHPYDTLRRVGTPDIEPMVIPWRCRFSPTEDEIRNFVISALIRNRYSRAYVCDTRMEISVLQYVSALMEHAITEREEFWEYFPEGYEYDGTPLLGKYAIASAEVAVFKKKQWTAF